MLESACVVADDVSLTLFVSVVADDVSLTLFVWHVVWIVCLTYPESLYFHSQQPYLYTVTCLTVASVDFTRF